MSLGSPESAIGRATTAAIPEHELIRPIASGSYGEVWLARSTLGVYRAVKIVRRSNFDHDRPFEREFAGIKAFEPISRSHENLVDLLQVGRNDEENYFYYVMELADDAAGPGSEGRGLKIDASPSPVPARQLLPCMPDPKTYQPLTLKAALHQRGRRPLDECILLGLSMTSALAYLHGQRLIHRDIKPSNIVFVGGVPKLADVGLVTSVSEARSYVGTEGFIAPEGPGTPQADLYSLGIVLYQMSTGKSHQDFPEPLPDLAVQPDHERWLEFNAVVHKACRAELRERYQSAEEMRAELVLLQSGASVRHKHSVEYRWAAAKRIGLVALAGVLLAAAVPQLFRVGGERYAESSNPDVNLLVDQGNTILLAKSPESVRQARDRFNAAIALDRKFVPAYWGLFGTYVYESGMEQNGPAEARQRVQEISKRLMEIDPDCAESLSASCGAKWADGQLQAALGDARRAVQARARCKDGRAWAHGGYGYFLEHFGSLDAALEQYKLAEKFSHSDPIIEAHIAHVYLVKREFKLALQYYQKSCELAPSQNLIHYFTGKVYEEEGRFAQAIDEFEKNSGDDSGNKGKPFYDGLRGAFQQFGAEGYWRYRLDDALKESAPDHYYVATLYAHVGRKAEAYRQLEEIHRQHGFPGAFMCDSCWDHNDPQFKAFARKIGLMQ